MSRRPPLATLAYNESAQASPTTIPWLSLSNRSSPISPSDISMQASFQSRPVLFLGKLTRIAPEFADTLRQHAENGNVEELRKLFPKISDHLLGASLNHYFDISTIPGMKSDPEINSLADIKKESPEAFANRFKKEVDAYLKQHENELFTHHYKIFAQEIEMLRPLVSDVCPELILPTVTPADLRDQCIANARSYFEKKFQSYFIANYFERANSVLSSPFTQTDSFRQTACSKIEESAAIFQQTISSYVRTRQVNAQLMGNCILALNQYIAILSNLIDEPNFKRIKNASILHLLMGTFFFSHNNIFHYALLEVREQDVVRLWKHAIKLDVLKLIETVSAQRKIHYSPESRESTEERLAFWRISERVGSLLQHQVTESLMGFFSRFNSICDAHSELTQYTSALSNRRAASSATQAGLFRTTSSSDLSQLATQSDTEHSASSSRSQTPQSPQCASTRPPTPYPLKEEYYSGSCVSER